MSAEKSIDTLLKENPNLHAAVMIFIISARERHDLDTLQKWDETCRMDAIVVAGLAKG